VPVPWKNCGSGSDIIKVQSVDASVWPVSRGKQEVVNIRATVGQQINGGTYELKVTFDGLPLVDKKGNIKDLNISLPIPAGPWVKNITINVPSFIPPGTANAHVVLKDDAGRSALCANVDVPFKVDHAFEAAQAEELAAMPTPMVGVPIPYKNCGKPDDKLKVTKAEASIWPPKVGQPIALALNATLTQDVSGGKYEAKVKFLGIQIIDQKGSIADLAKLLNVTLPIKAGPYGFAKTEKIPAGVPKGDIDVWVQAFNQNNAEIACIEVNAKLS